MFGLSAGDWTGIIQTSIIVGGTCYSCYQAIKRNLSSSLKRELEKLVDSTNYHNERLTKSIDSLDETIKGIRVDVETLETRVSKHDTQIAVLQEITHTAD
ncbi:hypothetical protein [Fructobacillus evanidus]|uniref:Uncharacterized protein n=1 Tax=Fructobacillus evanidus TaxID=3064281 RepID=A0ABN9YMT1_9LACO|nr:unnamed protein product [Fructobacillus sp. LMG 32999]CAK1222289.1 unnamed protein product [Fructobacillus sp. LMG 32999]CAK1225368.1 unnamed protein product [Fructobacillus sp. LMG 32999]CAK1225589.1 unnamed protein product [Fructobacillus sp. LMG 32999]CAK1225762.1 unnamed protein product [Fructobacillus sp. LMG 32999]